MLAGIGRRLIEYTRCWGGVALNNAAAVVVVVVVV